MRVALNVRRNKADQTHDELPSGSDVEDAAARPDIELVRARYKQELEDAIRSAARTLSTRERTILRMHLAERMSIDRLAVIYGVGRSTAARWLQSARAALADSARANFCARVGVAAAEFDSIAAMLRSDLELSLAHQLASSAIDDDPDAPKKRTDDG
jgi:RNA polymerase sigma-70 factor (ECF subfamily)